MITTKLQGKKKREAVVDSNKTYMRMYSRCMQKERDDKDDYLWEAKQMLRRSEQRQAWKQLVASPLFSQLLLISVRC